MALQALMIAPEKSTSSAHHLIVIDEIGKMELLSEEFVHLVRTVYEQKHCTVLATIPVAKGRPIALLEELRKRQDCQVFEVNNIMVCACVYILLCVVGRHNQGTHFLVSP